MAPNNELPIPDAAKSDSQSLEILRLWVANKGQHVSLRSGVWDDPAAWGVMLADLARHIVNSYGQTAVDERRATLERIKLGFEIELSSPTDDPSGTLR
jgi:hypothetical protein